VEPSAEFDIQKYARMIYARRVLFVLIVMLVTTVLVVGAYLKPKLYEAKSIIFVERQLISDLTKNVAIAPSYEDRIRAISIVVKSRNFLMRVLSDLGIDVSKRSAESLEGLMRDFQNSTEIRIDMGTANRKDVDVFTVSYVGADPVLASNYVNALVRRYILDNLAMKQQETSGANQFLLEQIDVFKKKIARSEADIARIRKDKRVVTNERLVVLQKKLGDLLMQYTEDHPEVIKAKAEIEQLQEQAKLKKGASSGSPSAEMAAADGESGGQSQSTEPLSPASDAFVGNKSLLDLEHQRDMNKRIYEELLATLGKSEFSAQVEVHDKTGAFKIVEPAIIPTKPISRNVMKMILLGIVGGIAAGSGLIVALDFLDSSLRSVEDVKKLGLPVLAIIPNIQTVREAARVRQKDRLLYAAAGVYLTGLLAVIAVEMMGLPYVDNAVQQAQAQITSSLKRIR